MDPPALDLWDAGMTSPTKTKRPLLGPRPAPLKVSKESNKIKKTPLKVIKESNKIKKTPVAPVKFYSVSTEVIHTTADDFISVVQRLTGSSSPADAVVHGGDFSPAARLYSIEGTSNSAREKEMEKTTESMSMVEGLDMGQRRGILSPAPWTLPPVPSGIFSPEFDINLLSWFNDLSPSFDNNKIHESNCKLKAIEDPFEEMLTSIYQDSTPLKVESEFESSNQDESSLTNDWMAQEITLTNGRCSELPENQRYPFLVKLLLQHNTYLTEIPPSFFEYMPSLKVLDMSNTSIKTLPSSISKLFRLRELLLRGCEMLMELPSEIRHLTNLKVLDLEGTELICLPKQIGWLLQLECLKFSLYKYADHHKDSSIISKETLSKLSSLKELSIHVYPDSEWWDAEVEAIIADLGKLGNLETLKLYLPTHELFQQLLERRCIKRLKMGAVMPLLYPTLSNFQFVVGRHEDPIMSCVPRDLQDEFVKLEKCLKYVNLGEYLDAKVLEHVCALFLCRHWIIRSLSEFDLTKMDNLKFCLLAECDWMRTILNGHQLNRMVDNKGGKSILGSLCYLGIHYMKNLCSIWKGPLVTGCLSNLKILAIHTCPKLTTIFNHGFLEDLIFLQELIVEDCPKVRSLLARDYSNLKRDLLPSLKKISFIHLPYLENISHGQFIASRLEKMVIYDCPKLKNLHPLEMCSEDVKEIKGESNWWESNKPGWSREQHDYLVSVFVPLKVVDDDDDDDSIDELAEAVRISLTSQVTERNEDLVTNMDVKMEDRLEELVPMEIGTSKSLSNELVPLEASSSEFSTSNPDYLSSIRFNWFLVAEPRKNPELPFACTLVVVSLSGCNLSDDSMPRDLSFLSSLKSLDLSFTPISTLNKRIKWPNGLKLLILNGCRNLRFLTHLPLVQELDVNECKALEIVNFGSSKLNFAPVSLLSHGCGRLVKVDRSFRWLEPIENFNTEVMNSWEYDNFESLRNVEVELRNNMTRTRKKLPLQGQGIDAQQSREAAHINIFSSGIELASMLVSSDLLHKACTAICNTPVSIDNQDPPFSISIHVSEILPNNGKIIAFRSSLNCTVQNLEEGKDLVPSTGTFFDFLATKVYPCISINKAAVQVFASLFEDYLSVLQDQIDISKPLLVTGNSLGGSIASLFTIWLLDTVYSNTSRLPICITFGSPLLGDIGFQKAIYERSSWPPCFLHVALSYDPILKLFVSPSELAPTTYKPFGSFLFCSESGCACFNQPESVFDVMVVMSSKNVRNINPGGIQIEYYRQLLADLNTSSICKGISKLGGSDLNPLQAGIVLQLEAIGIIQTQQQEENNDTRTLIEHIRKREENYLIRKRYVVDAKRKLNEIKISMAYLDWFKNVTVDEGGYYDGYKKADTLEKKRRRDRIKLEKAKLAIYWKDMVEKAEQKPQKEAVSFRTRWLFAGTNYKRMVEPLEIADYYLGGNTDYINLARPKHFIMMEKWFNDDKKLPTQTSFSKESKKASLTEDSCFWAHVEEAIISLSVLKNTETSQDAKDSTLHKLECFEVYVMGLVKDRSVSHEIFLEKSTFMGWWEEYKQYKKGTRRGGLYSSPLANFMSNGRQKLYL